MAKNLVLCSDGTCNAFGRSSSNVARLLEFIELGKRDTQIVGYDQGVGTRVGQHREITTFTSALGGSGALHLLPPPKESVLFPWTWPSLITAMAYGTGLDANVGQLYETLARWYEPDDHVYLFGFSRGAFTVRALAGLVWRYGLPSTADDTVARARFAEAWPLFVAEFPDDDGTAAAKAVQFKDQHGHRDCRIHFLGLWDTVKSYGGLQPLMLPHLRHNPAVGNVRHAVSLDEERGWFELTTWGWLDSDRQVCAAGSRLAAADAAHISQQDVVEVWFNGCHADVGGGGRNRDTAAIALRWMLGEAHHFGLELNDKGRRFLSVPATDEHPSVTPSRTRFWRVIECKQRQAITNAGRWPARFIAERGASPRQPRASIRDNTLWHHESATDLTRFVRIPEGVTLKPRSTLRLHAAPQSTPAMPPRPANVVARLTALGFAIGAAVHAIGFLLMGMGIYLYGPGYPAWRHVAMATADAGIAVVGRKRPRWLFVVLPAWITEQTVVNGFGGFCALVTAALVALAWKQWRTRRARRSGLAAPASAPVL